MRSMNDQEHIGSRPIRVSAPVDDPDAPVWREVLLALPDPADADQAIVQNVPFLNEELNFGDLVRLGPADECGIRPILEVVIASGHVHVLAATEAGEAGELAAELERMFGSYALRVEASGRHLVAVSAHPDLDPAEVHAVIEAWLAKDAADEEEGLALSRPAATRIGPVRWTEHAF